MSDRFSWDWGTYVTVPGDRSGDGPVDRRSLRFTRVGLTNWRNLTTAQVALRPRMFLVGPNASGKSNLLDAFRFLADVVSVGGGFQSAVARRGGVAMLRSFAARRNSTVTLRATLANGCPRSGSTNSRSPRTINAARSSPASW